MKILSLIAIGFFCVIIFLIGGFPLSEGYNPVKPEVGTKFSVNYSEENFNKITVGMDSSEVFKIMGEPLGKLPNHAPVKRLWYYSVDKKSDWADFAWLKRAIVYGSNGKVKEIQKSIRYE